MKEVEKSPEQLAEIKSRAEYALWMAQQRKDGGDWPPKDKKEDWSSPQKYLKYRTPSHLLFFARDHKYLINLKKKIQM